jgi:predicted double-glycine peptidase
MRQATWFFSALLALLAGQIAAASEQDGLDSYRSCGLTSFLTASRVNGVALTFDEAKEKLGPSRNGGDHTFADLEQAFDRVGLVHRTLQTSPEHLRSLPMPAIVQTRYAHGVPEPHFVVVLKTTNDHVYLLDPPYPMFAMSWSDFERAWTGYCLLVNKAEAEGKLAASVASLTASPLRFWGPLLLALVFLSLATLGHRPLGRVAIYIGRPLARFHRRARTAAVACLLAGAAVLTWLAWPEARPMLKLPDRSQYHLGLLQTGQQTKTLSVRNEGRLPLEIHKIVSSCTCAVVSMPSTIEPGESADILIKLHVQGGIGHTSLKFETNEPEGSRIFRLTWTGFAQPVASPRSVTGFLSDQTGPITRTVRVYYPRSPEISPPVFKRLESDSPLLRAVVNDDMAGEDPRGLESNLFAQSSLALDITVTPPGDVGNVESNCQLVFDYCGREEAVPLRVFFTYQPELTPDVNKVLFSAAKADSIVGQSRKVIIRTHQPPHTLRVYGLPDWLESSFEPMEKQRVILVLTVRRPPPPGASIDLRISTSANPMKSIPIQVATFVGDS